MYPDIRSDPPPSTAVAHLGKLRFLQRTLRRPSLRKEWQDDLDLGAFGRNERVAIGRMPSEIDEIKASVPIPEPPPGLMTMIRVIGEDEHCGGWSEAARRASYQRRDRLAFAQDRFGRDVVTACNSPPLW